MHLLLAIALSLCGCAPHAAPPAAAEPVQDESEVPEAIARAMPRVVLLLAEGPDGGQGYGAGILLEQPGRVLTNLHVVEGARRIQVLRHDPGRVSYSPLDGGLSRMVFENEGELADARLLRADPVLDLALVEVEGLDAIEAPPLPIRTEPLRPGERVFALGHPKESVWSFTAGVVSATHQGVIQHDAPINQGNSGGPLVDARGRLVGVNTMKLLGGTEGIGFARPMALAAGLIHDASALPAVDRSSPDQAMISCERAIELQPQAIDACIDWQSALELAEAGVRQAAGLLALDAEQTETMVWLVVRSKPDAVRARTRAGVLAHLLSEPLPPPARPTDLSSLWADEAQKQQHLEQQGVEERIIDEARQLALREAARPDLLLRQNGLQADLSRDGRAYREVRRMGLRVEDMRLVGEDAAWVRIRGRNLDGNSFQYAECWHLSEDGWRQGLVCSPSMLAALPEGWPPPVADAEGLVRHHGLLLAARVAEVDLGAVPPTGPGAVATDGGSGGSPGSPTLLPKGVR